MAGHRPTGGVVRANYLTFRARLLQMAQLAKNYSMTWVLQPDWKFLEAAKLYEDTSVMASTGGVNVFRYLRDTQGVTIDPHSQPAGPILARCFGSLDRHRARHNARIDTESICRQISSSV